MENIFNIHLHDLTVVTEAPYLDFHHAYILPSTASALSLPGVSARECMEEGGWKGWGLFSRFSPYSSLDLAPGENGDQLHKLQERRAVRRGRLDRLTAAAHPELKGGGGFLVWEVAPGICLSSVLAPLLLKLQSIRLQSIRRRACRREWPLIHKMWLRKK